MSLNATRSQPTKQDILSALSNLATEIHEFRMETRKEFNQVKERLDNLEEGVTWLVKEHKISGDRLEKVEKHLQLPKFRFI